MADKNANAKQAARAVYDEIARLVRAVERAEGAEFEQVEMDEAKQAIDEHPLSVEVRSGWYTPGADKGPPAEYMILLCTGGPAVRIIGDLNEHGEPESARLQWQDWFVPWTDWRTSDKIESTLRAYASCFYFGEG